MCAPQFGIKTVIRGNSLNLESKPQQLAAHLRAHSHGNGKTARSIARFGRTGLRRPSGGVSMTSPPGPKNNHWDRKTLWAWEKRDAGMRFAQTFHAIPEQTPSIRCAVLNSFLSAQQPLHSCLSNAVLSKSLRHCACQWSQFWPVPPGLTLDLLPIRRNSQDWLPTAAHYHQQIRYPIKPATQVPGCLPLPFGNPPVRPGSISA